MYLPQDRRGASPVVQAARERRHPRGIPPPAPPAVTAQLEREGVRSFCDSYHQLLGCIERKIAAGAAR